jgi:type II secretory pathway pseudopilin PulG
MNSRLQRRIRPVAGRPGCPGRAGRGEESGYTLLLVVFFAAVMIIAASVAVPNMILQARRRKEKELIWRGEQYARAIGLYYRKTGHYPHNLRELWKGVDGIHFLRKRYKDPMNTQDGSWRLIYLGPGGQLIGSLRWKTLAQYEAAQMGLPIPKATTGKTKGKKSSVFGNSGESSGSEGNGFSQPQPQIISEGQMIGGNLIGVASKVNAKSIKVFMGSDNYRDWEFIWNPLQAQKNGSIQTTSPANGKTPTSGKPAGPEPPKPTSQPF